MLNTTWLDTVEQNRTIESELRERRNIAASDRQARGWRQARNAHQPPAPRTLRRAMGGALIAMGRALAA